jgi:hypothetical protein
MSERYEPKVAILEEIRQDLMRAARAQTAAAAGAARATDMPPPKAEDAPRPRVRRRPPPRSRTLRVRSGARVARRVTLLGALIALIGGVALAATLSLSGSGPAENTAPVRLASGKGWTLAEYRHEGRLCVRLSTAEPEISVECAPTPGPLRITSALDDGRRLIGGLVGPRVRAVDIHVGPRHRRLETKAAKVAAIEARAVDLPVHVRWFLLEVRGLGDYARRAPADLLPLTADGSKLGRATLDCSLRATSPACLRAASGQAEAELR